MTTLTKRNNKIYYIIFIVILAITTLIFSNLNEKSIEELHEEWLEKIPSKENIQYSDFKKNTKKYQRFSKKLTILFGEDRTHYQEFEFCAYHYFILGIEKPGCDIYLEYIIDKINTIYSIDDLEFYIHLKSVLHNSYKNKEYGSRVRLVEEFIEYYTYYNYYFINYDINLIDTEKSKMEYILLLEKFKFLLYEILVEYSNNQPLIDIIEYNVNYTKLNLDYDLVSLEHMTRIFLKNVEDVNGNNNKVDDNEIFSYAMNLLFAIHYIELQIDPKLIDEKFYQIIKLDAANTKKLFKDR